MRKFSFALSIGLFAAVPAFAASDLLSYLVFSRSSIQTQHSDYQGATGAIGDIRLSNYEILGDLESGSGVSLRDGSITGLARAPRVQLTRAAARRGKYQQSTVNRLNGAANELESLSSRLSGLPATATASAGSADIRGQRIDGLKIQALNSLEVVNVSEAELRQASNLILEGSTNTLLVVRFFGRSPDFRGKGVFTSGGIRPEQIIFFFPEAESLNLLEAGGAADPVSGTSWGIPATVIAPWAVVCFNDILVTGQLYVGAIETVPGKNGGQVNRGRSLLLDRWFQSQPQPRHCNCR